MNSQLKKITFFAVLLVIVLFFLWTTKNLPMETTDENNPKEITNETAVQNLFDVYEEWNGEIRLDAVTNNAGFIHKKHLGGYGTGAEIHYHEDKLQITLHFPLSENISINREDLEQFKQQYITLSDTAPEYDYVQVEPLITPDGLMIDLDVPAENFTLTFKPNAKKENIKFHFNYMAPYDYTITAPDDEYFEAFFDKRLEYQPLIAGKTYRYKVHFSTEVHRPSAEERLPNQDRVKSEIEWLNDQTLTMKLSLNEDYDHDDNDRYVIGFNGLKNNRGQTLRMDGEAPILMLKPSTLKTFNSADLKLEQKTLLFESFRDYVNVHPSLDQSFLITEQQFETQGYYRSVFSLLDHNGKNIKYKIDGNFISWLPEHRLLMLNRETLFTYDVITGIENTVFKSTGDAWIEAVKYHEPSGKIVVVTMSGNADGSPNKKADLYLLDSIEDTKPKYIKDLFHVFCFQGVCSAVLSFVDENTIYFVDDINEDLGIHKLLKLDSMESKQISNNRFDYYIPLSDGKLLRIQESDGYTDLFLYNPETEMEEKLLRHDFESVIKPKVLPVDENGTKYIITRYRDNISYLLDIQEKTLKTYSSNIKIINADRTGSLLFYKQ